MKNALNFIIKLQGISVIYKKQSDLSETTILAAQSNYFRNALVDESITRTGRSYVIGADSLSFIPNRGDEFIVSAGEYYGVSDAQEMRALGEVIGYRIFLQ